MNAPSLHTTVATTPTGGLSVAADVALVKAALLYSDTVTLASGTAAMIDAAVRLLEASPTIRARRVLEVASVLLDPDQQALLGMMGNRKARRSIRGYAAFEAGLQANVAEVERVITGFAQDSGLRELDAARAAGLLTIDTLGLDPVGSVQDAVLRASGKPSRMTDDVVSGLVARIGDAATAGSGTYPIFDEGASSLVAAMIREGKLARPAGGAVGQSALAGHVIGYIPAFPDATVAEIVDVRGGLERPLIRFRGAMTDMARELEDAPWDAGFRQEADDLWRAQVAPALDDLEENAREQGALSLLRHSVTSAAPWIGGATVVEIAIDRGVNPPGRRGPRHVRRHSRRDDDRGRCGGREGADAPCPGYRAQPVRVPLSGRRRPSPGTRAADDREIVQ